MLSDSVVTAPDTLEARFVTLGIGRQSRLNRGPAQRFARESFCHGVDIARSHRLPRQFEH